MKNQEIAQIFYNIADILEMKRVEWKPRAYRKAARTLESLSTPVENIYKDGGIKALEEIPGVGEGLAKKIEQYIKTGKIKEYEKLKKALPKGLVDLMKVQGLGPKKAQKLYKKLGIKSIKDLEKAAKKHKIQKIKTFKEKTEENILKGIELFKQKKGRMLLGLALPQSREIISQLKKIKGVQQIEAAGSLRRMKETIGDIDILVTSRHPKLVVNFFTRMPSVKRVLAKGDTKSAVILKTGLQVDVRVLAPSSFGSALQYFTGSKDHNIKLRAIAIKKGFKLSEYGLFTKKGNKRVAGRTEEEVYRKLSLPYIEPELRENNGEIEVAKKRNLPKLICLKDIRGDSHVHTKNSDGTNTIKEIAEACKKLGYEYVCITDHSKTAVITHGLTEKRLEKQIREIRKLDKKIKGIKILAGTEVDILGDGKLDFSNEILKKLDVVTASIHKKFKLSKKKMTERILNAMSNENVDILAHPTGRLLGERKAYDFDFDKVFKAAKDTRTALEINAQPKRLDLNGYLVKEAKKYGVKFVVATDSHSTEQLRNIELGVATARRGWCEKKDVINTLPLKRFLKALK
ncbi:MAG: DNA polymerase/3'-5' exonuclease PolX [Nanoarchaeota archaeon]|nr:DNA polymerase/3'-5' exonuclease PolX [Nanoarchaeota archaeon]